MDWIWQTGHSLAAPCLLCSRSNVHKQCAFTLSEFTWYFWVLSMWVPWNILPYFTKIIIYAQECLGQIEFKQSFFTIGLLRDFNLLMYTVNFQEGVYGKGNLPSRTYLTAESFYKMEHRSQVAFHGTHCEKTLFSFYTRKWSHLPRSPRCWTERFVWSWGLPPPRVILSLPEATQCFRITFTLLIQRWK